MKSRVGFLVFITILLMPWTTVCAQRPCLNMGILPVIDTLPLIVAHEKGLFEQQGIDVKILSFNSALERDAALTSGRIDGYFGDLVITLLLNSKGEDLKVLTESYHTTSQQTMFSLLSSPGSDIRTPADIGDTPVAISSGTIIEYFLDAVLSSCDVSPSQVKKLEIKAIPIRYQMLMGDSVELAMLPDPLVSKALKGGAHIIADDRRLDTTATILAIKADVLGRYPGLAIRFLLAYSQSVAMINANPGEYMATLALKTRFPKDLLGKYSLPPFPEPCVPSKESVEAVEAWLKDKGFKMKTGVYEDLVWQGVENPKSP